MTDVGRFLDALKNHEGIDKWGMKCVMTILSVKLCTMENENTECCVKEFAKEYQALDCEILRKGMKELHEGMEHFGAIVKENENV